MNLDSAAVVEAEVILLDVDDSTDFFVDRVRKPADVDTRVDLGADKIRLHHSQVARIDEHQRRAHRLLHVALVKLDRGVTASTHLVVEASQHAALQHETAPVRSPLDSESRRIFLAEIVHAGGMLVHSLRVHPEANLVDILAEHLLLFFLIGEVTTQDASTYLELALRIILVRLAHPPAHGVLPV